MKMFHLEICLKTSGPFFTHLHISSRHILDPSGGPLISCTDGEAKMKSMRSVSSKISQFSKGSKACAQLAVTEVRKGKWCCEKWNELRGGRALPSKRGPQKHESVCGGTAGTGASENVDAMSLLSLSASTYGADQDVPSSGSLPGSLP